MNDRPTAQELLEAVRRFLLDEAVPALDGHLKYQARVAGNVVAIVAREIESDARHTRGEWERLGALLAADEPYPQSLESAHEGILVRNRELVERIRAGDGDSGRWREALVEHLKRTTVDKLEVAKG